MLTSPLGQELAALDRNADGIIGHVPALDLDDVRAWLEHGASEALDRLSSSDPRIRRADAYELARAGWQVMVPITRDAVIVHIGDGLGAVGRSLARRCQRVIGVDDSYARLMINAAINREQGIDNIDLLFGMSTLGRFRPDSVDGVALSEATPEPALLDTVRRILKDDGWLYVAAEGRQRRRLVTQLRLAGFPIVSVYFPVPDHHRPELLLPPTGNPRKAGVARALGVVKPWKRRIVEMPPMFRRLASSVGCVASAHVLAPPAWLRDLEPARINHVYIKYDQATIWHGAGAWRVRDVALSDESAVKLERIERLSRLLSAHPDCPKALKNCRLHRHDGFVWADRPYVDGRTLEGTSPTERAAARDAVLACVRRVNALGTTLPADVMGLSEVFHLYAPNAPAVVAPQVLTRVRAVIERVDSLNRGGRLLMHGDCSAKNIVATRTGPELIDWEWSQVVNFPGYDVLKLAWHDREDPSIPVAEQWPYDRYEADQDTRIMFEAVHGHDDWGRAVLTYWILRFARAMGRYRHGGMPPRWVEQHAMAILAALEASAIRL